MSSTSPQPPPQPPPSSSTPTLVAGQQAEPSTAVPHTPGLPGYAPSSTQTNNLAVVSLVAGILSFFGHVIPVFGGAAVAVVAIVTGFMARGQIRQTGEQGMWMATAGIVIGIIHLVLLLAGVLLILFLIFVVGIALFGIAAHGGGTMPSPVPSG